MSEFDCVCYSTTKAPIIGTIDFPCDKPAKFIVSYLSSVSKGKRITEYRCPRHKNALVKNVERIKKICGFDSELTVTSI